MPLSLCNSDANQSKSDEHFMITTVYRTPERSNNSPAVRYPTPVAFTEANCVVKAQTYRDVRNRTPPSHSARALSPYVMVHRA